MTYHPNLRKYEVLKEYCTRHSYGHAMIGYQSEYYTVEALKNRPFSKQLEKHVVDLMNRYPDYGAIACRPQVLVADTMKHFETDDEVVEFPRIPGYARIMRTKWVNEVGAWKDKRPLRGHEEIWISEKFREKGYRVGWANNIGCWHLFGKEDTDEWGYPKNMKPEDHGHNPVWPMPKNDKDEILKRVGISL
jgi:hypothetical protein